MACGRAVSGERVMSGDTLGVEEARNYGGVGGAEGVGGMSSGGGQRWLEQML